MFRGNSVSQTIAKQSSFYLIWHSPIPFFLHAFVWIVRRSIRSPSNKNWIKIFHMQPKKVNNSRIRFHWNESMFFFNWWQVFSYLFVQIGNGSPINFRYSQHSFSLWIFKHTWLSFSSRLFFGIHLVEKCYCDNGRLELLIEDDFTNAMVWSRGFGMVAMWVIRFS